MTSAVQWLFLSFVPRSRCDCVASTIDAIKIRNWQSQWNYLLLVNQKIGIILAWRTELLMGYNVPVEFSLTSLSLSQCNLELWMIGFNCLTSCIVLSGFFDDMFKNRSWAWQNLPVFLSNFFLCSLTPPIRSFRNVSNGTTIWLWACAIWKFNQFMHWIIFEMEYSPISGN